MILSRPKCLTEICGAGMVAVSQACGLIGATDLLITDDEDMLAFIVDLQDMNERRRLEVFMSHKCFDSR